MWWSCYSILWPEAFSLNDSSPRVILTLKKQTSSSYTGYRFVQWSFLELKKDFYTRKSPHYMLKTRKKIKYFWILSHCTFGSSFWLMLVNTYFIFYFRPYTIFNCPPKVNLHILIEAELVFFAWPLLWTMQIDMSIDKYICDKSHRDNITENDAIVNSIPRRRAHVPKRLTASLTLRKWRQIFPITIE